MIRASVSAFSDALSEARNSASAADRICAVYRVPKSRFCGMFMGVSVYETIGIFKGLA